MNSDCLQLAFMSPSPSEMLLVMLIALLVYGGDLPRVARTWGKTLAEFRKSMSGIQNDLRNVLNEYDDSPRRLPYYESQSPVDTTQEVATQQAPDPNLDYVEPADTVDSSESSPSGTT
jgi:Sec-independent protein translocase protein TatA